MGHQRALPQTLGRAAQGVIMGALTWWATEGESVAPGEAVRRAIVDLEAHLASVGP